MTSHDPSVLLPLLRKLEAISPLSEEEQQAAIGLPVELRALRTDQDVVREGDRPSLCCLLLDGFACRYKLLDDGRRQIFSFHVAGDFLDLPALYLPVMDHSVGILAPSRAAFIPHESLRALTRQHPRIGEALVRDGLIDGAVFREWMVGMGRRPVYGRIAHLLCEQVRRLQAAGLAQGNMVRLPITQAHVADSLGLAVVHANRVLRQLQDEGLIAWKGEVLSVLDWERLRRAGEFDPAYLRLAQDEAA